jgi:hypothetical protein
MYLVILAARESQRRKIRKLMKKLRKEGKIDERP